MNPRLEQLQPYPFQRLAALLQDITPADNDTIALSIGEPQHAPPAHVREAMIEALDGLAHYPATRGQQVLRQAIADWLAFRFNLGVNAVDPQRQVLPAAGTREALFAFAQAVVTPGDKARVAMPNPGYQIYEGAALLAGARPMYLPCRADTGFVPDLDAVDEQDWNNCELLYLCSPGNPTGAQLSIDYWQRALELAERHDFIIAADECYSEIYPDEANPPPGLLQAAQAAGNTDFKRCVVFHSLSKRSNLPGLRSGFVAGDAEILDAFARYRTYHGATLGNHTQAASIAAWSDETHVRDNRERYRAKFDAVIPILEPVLDVARPDGSFYLWPHLPVDDETFTRELLAKAGVRGVPGRYLARDTGDGNPGANRLRLSLVASEDACVEAAWRIRRLCEQLAS